MTNSDCEAKIDFRIGNADSSVVGFYSDVSPKGRHFRLTVDSAADGWTGAVIDLDSKARIKKDLWAATADTAKTKTAEFMRSVIHYIGPIDWRRK